jgi:hypothetical protein
MKTLRIGWNILDHSTVNHHSQWMPLCHPPPCSNPPDPQPPSVCLDHLRVKPAVGNGKASLVEFGHELHPEVLLQLL